MVKNLRAVFLFGLGSVLLVFDAMLNTPGEVKPVPAAIYGGLLGVEFVLRGDAKLRKPEEAKAT